MSPSDETVLEAENLTRKYAVGSLLRRGHVSAVDGVSLRLRRGEALGVVGESGCGKSTLARMLVGLERPDSGRLRYHGEDVTAGRRRDRHLLRAGVQMIFQDPYASLDPRMTVLDIVAEPLAANRSGTRASRRERVAELLDLVGMAPDMMSRYPHQFSGGQRQRIGIARALALDPKVLICDEPVSALDVSVQAQVINLLAGLQRRLDVALVFIAHDLSVVRHLADRVAVMYLGRIAETGDTTTLYDSPSHPYTKALLSAVPPIDRSARGRLTQRRILAGEPPSPVDPPAGCRFNPRCWLAEDRCRTEIPLLRPVDGRESACHLAEAALAEA
ncbi:ABC transporter ATP-binding protein [Actinocrispum wychmicini]|uniref:Peptide/nickel transport system ATP-binding protein/oligopeptide transport system ATP-binding protein n=1 Tax=Actinocrispum wychmicini TaxID=1213861 RepID=A0A4R2JKK3_9PSEU|nr:dipeptide ABC transporter ATP-binding protein [Actinocrispum wychmicini]TCO59684.1 peptide/nickel transport system ATP-binding protein/oligopeptide transport system ATP-binding protein [Actinocrispum wychmicini]